MKKHNDWIDISYRKMAHEKEEKKNGIIIRITTSPYDIPHKWRINNLKRFGKDVVQFEFQYLSEEPTRNKKIDSVEFVVGKNSRRVHRINIPKDDNTQIKLELIFEQLRGLERQGTLAERNANIIQSLIEQHEELAYA